MWWVGMLLGAVLGALTGGFGQAFALGAVGGVGAWVWISNRQRTAQDAARKAVPLPPVVDAVARAMDEQTRRELRVLKQQVATLEDRLRLFESGAHLAAETQTQTPPAFGAGVPAESVSRDSGLQPYVRADVRAEPVSAVPATVVPAGPVAATAAEKVPTGTNAAGIASAVAVSTAPAGSAGPVLPVPDPSLVPAQPSGVQGAAATPAPLPSDAPRASTPTDARMRAADDAIALLSRGPRSPAAQGPGVERGASATPWIQHLPAPLQRLLFGGNTLVKVGVVILFLGLAFLLRYTAERVTVPIGVRYGGVALVGAALLGLGWWLRERRAVYALTLQGAGIGVFYLTTLAAMKLHPLLAPETGFALLFAVAVLSAVLAVRQNAAVLAIVAALEGFAAPVLASTGANNPVGLFSYLLVLDIGILLVAWKRAWRPLHLIGFVGTFVLATAWAQRYYSPDQYGVAQAFLVMFFLLFTLIGVLFAHRTLHDAPAELELSLVARTGATLRRVGRVDSALVFGVPMVGFGLQYVLVEPWRYGAALSALVLMAFYLLLAQAVTRARKPGLALLAEAFVVVAVIFGTLAIPLGFEGRWTGASWAIEAAGMYWLGVRQSRPYARGFALAVLVGAVFKLLGDMGVSHAPSFSDIPRLQGSTIGPLVLGTSALVMWLLYRRSPQQERERWEPALAAWLPWLGVGALALLPWQWIAPAGAATATAVLGVLVFAAAVRWTLPPLVATVHALHLLAVVGWLATLELDQGSECLSGGWAGASKTVATALCILLVLVWSEMRVRRATAAGLAPDWVPHRALASVVVALLIGASPGYLLNNWPLIWTWALMALPVLWIALRLAIPALAGVSVVLHGAAGALWLLTNLFGPRGPWTTLLLAGAALVSGDLIRAAQASRLRRGHATNGWCANPFALWLPLLVGLAWWLIASLPEIPDRLGVSRDSPAYASALVGWVLVTSLAAAAAARWRQWLQLGRATAATVPALVLTACFQVNISADFSIAYLPSAHGGWWLWPLALAWHLRLLRWQEGWLPLPIRMVGHVAGSWLFLLLAAREVQWRMGTAGDALSAWPLVGWAVVPALLLWALRWPVGARRWPAAVFRIATVEWIAVPVAAYLLGWVWLGNFLGDGGTAGNLPYLPLLNPLELSQWAVLAVLAYWSRGLPATGRLHAEPSTVYAAAAATGLALLTGTVLRMCHHWAVVPWEWNALYASPMAQASVSILWAASGVAAMVWGHRRRQRTVWVAGAGLLGVVVLKLFLVELADRDGLFRIVSFIGVGALVLLVGYFAPVPPLHGKATKGAVS